MANKTKNGQEELIAVAPAEREFDYTEGPLERADGDVPVVREPNYHKLGPNAICGTENRGYAGIPWILSWMHLRDLCLSGSPIVFSGGHLTRIRCCTFAARAAQSNI